MDQNGTHQQTSRPSKLLVVPQKNIRTKTNRNNVPQSLSSKQQQPCIQTRNLRAQKHLNGNPNHGKSLSRVSRGIFDRQRHGHMHAAELTVRENPGGSR